MRPDRLGVLFDPAFDFRGWHRLVRIRVGCRICVWDCGACRCPDRSRSSCCPLRSRPSCLNLHPRSRCPEDRYLPGSQDLRRLADLSILTSKVACVGTSLRPGIGGRQNGSPKIVWTVVGLMKKFLLDFWYILKWLCGIDYYSGHFLIGFFHIFLALLCND